MPDEVYIDSKAPNAETQWLLMNEKVKNATNASDIKLLHLREVLDLKDAHQREKDDLIISSLREIYDGKIATQEMKTDLIRNMSEKAIDKALESMNERQEISNNKFALLKEQAIEAERRFAQKTDLIAMEEKNQIRYEAQQKQIAALARVAAIALGILLTLQFLIPIVLKLFFQT